MREDLRCTSSNRKQLWFPRAFQVPGVMLSLVASLWIP